MTALPQQVWTPESYLAFEHASDEKHEYYAGDVRLMPRGNYRQTCIVGNTLVSLHPQARTGRCEALLGPMRLKVNAPEVFYTYADFVVLCGKPQLEDRFSDTLLNPTLIVEVLSPSTESYDRGKKFQLYRALESLQEYVLISQESYRIERFLRPPSGSGLLSDAVGLEATLTLSSIGCTLALADVYANVTLDDAPHEP